MNAEIKERLEQTLLKYSISQNRAAQDIGVSASALSQYRNGCYAGIAENVEDAIVKWIGRVERQHAKKKVPIVQTRTLNRICNAIQLAHTEQDIALIVDAAGSGKTTAARFYADANSKTTILISVIAGMNRKALVMELARQLSIETTHTNQQSLIRQIADTLADRDMVVILDEADYLKADALEFVRRIVYDLGHSGLVLIGLPRLTFIIQNLKNDHQQLESRIGVFLPLTGLSKEDAAVIAHSVWDDVGDEIINAVYGISRTDVRRFTKILERMQNTMQLNRKDKPDLDVVEMAASMVMKPRGGAR